MLVYGRQKVYKLLDKDKLKRLYVDKELDDIDLTDLINAKKEDNKYLEVNYVTKKELDELTDKDHQGIVAEKKDKFIFIILLLFASLLLFFVASGIGFSLYEENPINILPITPVKPVEPEEPVEPDTPTEPTKPPVVVNNIVLNYSDVNGNGNGINIKNAKSITDTEGMNLIGDGNVFDFTITGSMDTGKLKYYILLRKEDGSTLDLSKVKVYLTRLNGTLEESIMEPSLYSSLAYINISNTTLKTLYTKISTKKINDSYRLRLWVDEDATDYFNKEIKVKVDVYGEELGN